jgi:voltage-gated potassium channel
MRKRLFEIIEVAEDNDRLSKIYDFSMMVVIVISLIPIALKSTEGIIGILDLIVAAIFVFDYLMRLLTADYKLKRGRKSFIIYPITPMAIIDVLAILPSILPIYGAFRILKIFRLLRTLRVLRVFKIIRYSKSISIILAVLKRQKESLLVVCGLAGGYILVSALVIISVEPETFPTFFDAVYWATVSLTTVGYGDIYPVSEAGRFITMLSSVFGIAIVALPAGIIAAGYMSEIEKSKDENVNSTNSKEKSD